MREGLRSTFLNLVSSTYHAEYSWEEEVLDESIPKVNQDEVEVIDVDADLKPKMKTIIGSSFRVTRIPFWRAVTIQVEVDIQGLEEMGKTNVFLDYIRRV